jgi:hypothetical protein
MVNASDQAFSELNRNVVEHPHDIIVIDNYTPIQPWKVGDATGAVIDVHQFPSVEEMDNDFENWPSTGNPFTETMPTALPISNQASATQSVIHAPTYLTVPNMAALVMSILASENKLFFIAHKCTTHSQRREWKLVQVNLKRSIESNPA